MTDNSKFVVRWDIDESAAGLKNERKVEAGTFEQRGFKWAITAVRLAGNKVAFNLSCGVDHNGSWRCEGEVDILPLSSNGTAAFGNKAHFCFDETIGINQIRLKCSSGGMVWEYWIGPAFRINGKITMDFHINIISSNVELIADPSQFDKPNNRSDVILLIGDKKLHVSREMLAIHSPVFEAMFFGNFVENGKQEIEVKDVVYEEFLDLLHLIYLGTMRITDRMIPYILKLADQFQMERLLEQSANHLIQSKGFDRMEKLLLADQYRLESLKNHCIQSFTTSTQIKKKLKSSPEYDNFSAETKESICDRIAKLALSP